MKKLFNRSLLSCCLLLFSLFLFSSCDVKKEKIVGSWEYVGGIAGGGYNAWRLEFYDNDRGVIYYDCEDRITSNQGYGDFNWNIDGHLIELEGQVTDFEGVVKSFSVKLRYEDGKLVTDGWGLPGKSVVVKTEYKFIKK